MRRTGLHGNEIEITWSRSFARHHPHLKFVRARIFNVNRVVRAENFKSDVEENE